MTRPRSLAQLIASLLLLTGLIGGYGPLPCGIPPIVHAAKAVDLPNQGKPPSRAKKSPVAAAPTSFIPTTIKNLRVLATPERTRLVLDLDRKAQFTKQHDKQSDRIVIRISNSALGQSAKTKLESGAIPSPFTITQASARTVAISMPTGSFQHYVLFRLENPPRLVIDVVPNQSAPSPDQLDQPEPFAPPAPPIQPPPPPSKPFKTIVLDPGHGGRDPGAHGQRGTEEKDVTLRVARKLRDLLSKQPGLRVLMTRERDVFIELEDRAKFANGEGADLFVSIHVNSHPQRSVKGLEVYHFGEAKDQRALEVAARENGTPLNTTGVGWEYLVADLLTAKKIEASLELAWNAKEAMVSHLNGAYSMTDHGVKTAPFYVLRFTSMPSILAEIAYISNQAEEELLRSSHFTTRVAESLQEGILTYLVANKTASR